MTGGMVSSGAFPRIKSFMTFFGSSPLREIPHLHGVNCSPSRVIDDFTSI